MAVHPSQPLALWLLLPTDNFVSYILCLLFFPYGFYSIISEFHPLLHLILPCHLFWNVSSAFLLCYSVTFLLSFLLPPTCLLPTHHHVDGERYVPEQNKGAAWSREDRCTLLLSLLRIIHLFAPLPHGRARHSWISRGGRRGACGPEARRKRGFCRRGRRQQQWQCVLECGWRTSAPVTHLPEHHSGAGALYGHHDSRWVALSDLSPSGMFSRLMPFPCRSHFMCAPLITNVSIQEHETKEHEHSRIL